MKIQDLVFFLVFLFVLWRRDDRTSVILGLFCLFLAIPLFQAWIFFTAERLTWYAATFFAYGIALQLIKLKKQGQR